MQLALTIFGGLVAGWMAFLVFLLLAKPEGLPARETARLLPDIVRLIKALATDSTLPVSQRAPLWLLVGYLVMPVDLVPDIIPVIGYADDVILVAFVLRRLIARAGPDRVDAHWRGTPTGLAATKRLLRLAPTGGTGETAETE
jgi:uncharacterized membrane protein YkvA (DUF1232 family)